MQSNIEIISKVAQKEALVKELDSLLYGSVEIRERGNSSYIYVHYREDGVVRTKYAGEYTDALYNVILNNTSRAKAIKKSIKKLDQELRGLGYVECDIPEDVAKNIDFAKRHLVDTIYNQAVLEGIATTYADTETIIEGGKVSNMAVDDVRKVINLKHAWEFVCNPNVLMANTDFGLMCEINRLVEEGFYYNAGKVRSTPVSIGGTMWRPQLPIESVVREELNAIIQSQMDIVDKAIEVLLYVMKRQIFIDGNKRTAVILANHMLIAKGKGLVVIPNDKVEEYKNLLIAYYEGKDDVSIKEFLRKFAFVEI